MKRWRGTPLLAVLLGGGARLAGESWAAEAPPPLSASAEVVSVSVPVFVLDARGEPIPGLKASDFRLRDGGKPVELSSFLEVTPQLLAAPGAWLPPEGRRNFLLLFDMAFSRASGTMRARAAAEKFVAERLRPADLVAVATYSTVRGFELVVPFTHDLKQIRLALSTLGLVGSSAVVQDSLGFLYERQPGSDAVVEEDDASSAEALQRQAAAEMQILFERMDARQEDLGRAQAENFARGLADLSLALDAVAGRKNVVLFSSGFDAKFVSGQSSAEFAAESENLVFGDMLRMPGANRYGSSELRQELYASLQRLVASNGAIFTIDLTELNSDVTLGGSRPRRAAGGSDTLFVLADRTAGNAYRKADDIGDSLADIEKRTGHYYLLGFEPTEVRREGKHHELKVEVALPGARVSHRKGYFEERPPERRSAAERRLEAADAIVKGGGAAGPGSGRQDWSSEVEVIAFPGAGALNRVAVLLTLRGADLQRGTPAGRPLRLEFYGYAIDARGQFRDSFHKAVAWEPDRARSMLGRAGVKYVDLLNVLPGPYRVRLFVRNPDTGEELLLERSVEVPDFAQPRLRLVGPMLLDPRSDWSVVRGYDPAAKPLHPSTVDLRYPFRVRNTEYLPGVRPGLRSGRPEQVVFEVHHLRVDPVSGAPQTALKVEALDARGQTRPAAAAALLGPPERGAGGEFVLLLQVELPALEPGEYRLRVSLEDRLAARSESVEAPFQLER